MQSELSRAKQKISSELHVSELINKPNLLLTHRKGGVGVGGYRVASHVLFYCKAP